MHIDQLMLPQLSKVVKKMLILLYSWVEHIGEVNMVEVISDSHSSFF